jgi:large subunit ribosomal protein L29
MAKFTELRDMSDEQIRLLLKETTEQLFHLRLQAQTERLDAPSELFKNRRLIARIKTIQRQREIIKEQAAAKVAPVASVEAGSTVGQAG